MPPFSGPWASIGVVPHSIMPKAAAAARQTIPLMKIRFTVSLHPVFRSTQCGTKALIGGCSIISTLRGITRCDEDGQVVVGCAILQNACACVTRLRTRQS